MSALEESPGGSRPSFPVKVGKYKIAPFPLSFETIGMGQRFIETRPTSPLVLSEVEGTREAHFRRHSAFKRLSFFLWIN